MECGIGKRNRNRNDPKFIGGILDHVRHLVSLLPVGSAAPDHTVPYGTVPSGDIFPGTSCLATISLSLRDKSHSPCS